MSRRKGERSLRKSYAIVGDGHTEKAYFDSLRGYEAISNLQIKPDLPSRKGSGYRGVLNRCESLLEEGYDRVYAIIDLDEVILNNLIDDLESDKKKMLEKFDDERFRLIFCNPCFEIWFLFHFRYTTRRFRRCRELIDELKKETELSDYSKSRTYIHRNNLYEKLRPRLFSHAVPNANKLRPTRLKHADRTPVCMINEIIKDLQIDR